MINIELDRVRKKLPDGVRCGLLVLDLWDEIWRLMKWAILTDRD